MFNEIPRERPATPLLDTLDLPRDLRRLTPDKLETLACELRHFLLYTVGRTGGHFGAGLGVIELTIALHYVFDTPKDDLIWDVGHQTYPHKILTGRRKQMHTLRQRHGLAPFPSQAESPFDVFGAGHSSTSISAALGIHLAGKINGKDSKTVVVIGDGAMTAGMAFEAINHVAACHADLLIILNDNAMSISENVGGLAAYFARNLPANDQAKDKADEPGGIFTDLGFHYTGPVDGHDINGLVATLTQLKGRQGPRLLHVITRKGKGFAPAERSPIDSHALTKLEKHTSAKHTLRKKAASQQPTYANIFGDWICRKAAEDYRLVGITPAMKEGSGLTRFAEEFPARFHDVAIAEQHAVTLAAGLATGGAKPVVAIYSTFLQRAYDQLIHDVAIQNLDVLFAVDRASLLEDGPTHAGVFDLSFARAIPNLVIMAPADDSTMVDMLELGYAYKGPCLVRFPRGAAAKAQGSREPLQLGKGVVACKGAGVALLAFGATLDEARQVAEMRGYTLVDMRFVKPLDEKLISEIAGGHELLVTVEENVKAGGAGSAVNEYLLAAGTRARLLNLGVPDFFLGQDTPAGLRETAGLTAEKIDQAIQAARL